MPTPASFYAGKRVLLTGGSSGIGLALARRLAGFGAHTALLARDPARLAKAADEIRARAGDRARLSTHIADVTDAAGVDAVVRAAASALGGLDIVINNAGFALPGLVKDLPLDTYEKMMATNYLGAVHVTRAALPLLLEQRSGAIVNVASMLGFMGMYGYGAYAASKFALAGFTECLRAEMAPHGVNVAIVYAPTTDTPGLARENLTKPPETWALESGSKQFSPEDVAEAILDGVARGRCTILAGFDSRMVWWAQRFAPGVLRWWLDRTLRRAQSRG